jgi:hypothetical protein
MLTLTVNLIRKSFVTFRWRISITLHWPEVQEDLYEKELKSVAVIYKRNILTLSICK